MQRHIMTFKTPRDKRSALKYIKKLTEVEGINECPVQFRLVFFTSDQYPREILKIQHICKPHSYKVSGV